MSDQQFQKQVVTLQLYKGSEILKRGDGTISNAGQTVTLFYGTFEWKNFLENIKRLGFGVASVAEYTVNGAKKECPASITAEVKKAILGDQEVKLTPEQKEIAELKAQMAAILAGQNANAGADDDAGKDNQLPDEALIKARQEYMDVAGKKGHHSWTVEELEARTAELKAQK